MSLKLDFSKVLVKDNTNRVKKAEADILLLADQIALKVTTETFNALEGRMEGAEASLEVQADKIALKVSSEDFTGETIASLINISPSTVKIKAKNIELEGIVTANEYFKILADGSIEAVNAKLSGSITATKMVSPINPAYYGEIGISDGAVGLGLFDTRHDVGPYMRIVELANGSGFSLMDTNNISRFSAQLADTRIADRLGQLGIFLADTSRAIFSPNGKNYIGVTDSGIQIVKDGVLKASW